MEGNELIKETSKILLATGAACTTAFIATPILTGALLSVAGGIAGNLASGYIDRLIEGNQVQKALLKTHPSQLNHHIQKSLVHALVQALENVQVLYIEKLSNKNQKQEVKQLIQNLKADVETQLKENTKDEKQIVEIIEQQGATSESLNKQLGLQLADLPVIDESFPLPAFFSQHFIAQLQLCFAEELKKPENHETWVAYQKMMLKDLKHGIEETLGLNRSILEKVESQNALSLNFPRFNKRQMQELQQLLDSINRTDITLEDRFEVALDKLVFDLKSKMDEVIALSKQTQEKVGEVKKQVDKTHTIVDTFDRTLRENWVSKYKVVLLITFGILLLILSIGITYIKSLPFDATAFLKPESTLKLNANYPAFQEGELSIYIGKEEKKAQVTANGEVVFKQVPADFKGEKVAVRLNARYWKTAADSLILDKNLSVAIIPDGSLALITGNVKTQDGKPLSGVVITVDNDTSFVSNAQGFFNVKLPYNLQKEVYRLGVSKEGFKPYAELYYAKSGNIDIRLEK